MVAGVGNRFRSDDRVGLALVEAWRGEAPAGVAVELWEEQDGASVAHRLLELARPVLIVDCADFGGVGGSCRLLAGAAIVDAAPRNVVSTHGLGLAQALPLAVALGHEAPLWLLGVQPFDVTVGEALSAGMRAALPALTAALAAAVTTILGELEQ